MPTWDRRTPRQAPTSKRLLDKAADAYAKAIALKPDNPAYHNNYALTLARSKKFDEAQAELNKAAAARSCAGRPLLLQSRRPVRQRRPVRSG